MQAENKGYNLTIPINGFQLSYDDVGDGDTPVIFLHGFPFDKTMWAGQLKFLESSHRAISCDIRGFGKSKDEESDLSIDMFGDDLIELMKALDIEKAIVCGLSMGGFIALNAMKRYPAYFDALILCDTQCIADTDEVKAKRYKTIEEIEENGTSDFNEKFIKSVFHQDALENKKEVVEQVRRVVFSNSKHIIQNGLTALAERSETCSSLNEIAIPTLIICGREDEVTPLAQSEGMNKAIEGSSLHVIDIAGHVSNLEQPDEFNKCLFDFLTEVSDFNFEKINGHERMS